MPRPMLNSNRKNQSNVFSNNTRQSNVTSSATNETRILRKKRSQVYMSQLAKLDSGQGQLSRKDIEEVISAVQSEFSEITLAGIFLGIVAKCYLGENYEVHTLDLTLEIVTHFRRGESLPGKLEKARGLANNPNYQYVEVYTDCCRCIDAQGNVATLKL